MNLRTAPLALALALLIVSASGPARPQTASPDEASAVHIVRPGETLWSIARHYGTTTRALARANRIRNARKLEVGAHLTVPGIPASAVVEPPISGEFVTHTVRRGETLQRISRRYGTTIEVLARINRIRNPRRLSIGTQLKVPVADAASTASAAPVAASAPRPIPRTPPVAARGADGTLDAADRLTDRADEQLRGARFEAALSTADSVIALLAPLDGSAAEPRRARVEVLRATAQVGLGRTDAALESLERALKADPSLVLSREETSPKVLEVYYVARRRVGGPPP